jgi:putative peptide zinc metalloprotease protein
MSGVGDSIFDQVVRLRPDIEWTQTQNRNKTTWIARDPVSMEYFHFQQQDYLMARQLDGCHSLKEIYENQQALEFSREALVSLVLKLENACLIVPKYVGGFSQRLWQIHSRRRNRLLQHLMLPLAVRIKLFDPTLILSAIEPLAQLLFSRLFALFGGTIAIGVWLTVFIRVLESPNSISSSFENMTTIRALGLVAIYVIVKSLHELGHALACKKWGAECHEIGVYFLMFTPCLYCNTTDSWKLSSRVKRALIAAAGIYIELIVATLGGLTWLMTTPESTLHLLGANTMLICSLSTVLVNGNPLLRYDGYYVLSDLWGVPNLADQARECLRACISGWLTNRRLPLGRWDAHPYALAIYGLVALVYRYFVALVVIWGVWLLMDSIGLNLVGASFALLSAINLVIATVIGMGQWIRELMMLRGIRVLRMAFVLVVLAMALKWSVTYELPTWVSGRAVTSQGNVFPVYAEHAGTLAEFSQVGQEVPAGHQLVRIESPKLDFQRIECRGKVAYLEERIQQLKSRLVEDASLAIELSRVIEELSKANEQLAILNQESQSLVSVANQDGVLMVADYVPTQTITEQINKGNTKPILSNSNLGCHVERGTLLGWFGKPGTLELTAVVTERDAELLVPGMKVVCRWDCQSATRYDGVISRISPDPVSEVPDALVGDESIPFRMGENGRPQPTEPHYEIKIALHRSPVFLSYQSLASVHFETAPRTLFQSLRRLFDTHVRTTL